MNIEKKYNSLLNVTDEVSISMLKDEVLEVPKSSKKVQLLDVFEKHNTEFVKRVNSGERSAASLQKYRRSAELLKNFIRKTYGVSNIDKINSAFIDKLIKRLESKKR